MNRKVNVLDIELDNSMAKEMLSQVVKYMQTEPLNIVEVINADVLWKCNDDETLKDNIAQADLVVAGERAVLELAEITDRKKLQEAESHMFAKLLLHFFHKNQSRIFLLAESAEELQKFTEYLEENYAGIKIVGQESVSNDRSTDDMILNSINGAEVDCVMSMIPSPVQEKFVVRNRILLNANMWVGLGKNAHLPLSKKKRSIREFFVKRFLKREVEKEKQKKRGNA